MNTLYASSMKYILDDLRLAESAARRIVEYDERGSREAAYESVVSHLRTARDSLLRAALSDVAVEPIPGSAVNGETWGVRLVPSVPASQTEAT